MRYYSFFAVICGTLGLAAIASGEVIGEGTGQQDLSAPSGITGWNNVGQAGDSSGVYLGNGWVITADHVAGVTNTSDFTLNGTAYPVVPNSQVQLDTVSSYGTGSPQGTDLKMFQISGTPGAPALSNLTLASAEPTAGENIYTVGFGLSRPANEALTDYYVTGSGSSTTWNTSPVAGQMTPNAAGYQESNQSGTTTSAGVRMWGNNYVEYFNSSTGAFGNSADPVVNTWNIGYGDVQGFAVQFYTQTTSQSGGDTEESQIALYDSGGGVFNDANQLIGINEADLEFTNQPADTAVLGDGSGFIDLYDYENQIDAIMGVPEPATASVILLGIGAVSLRRRCRI